MNELALFAGAGGGLLGSRLLGWRTVCAVEIDPYRQAVLLARQKDDWLDPFPIWDDVRTFNGQPWRGIVDVVTGGFPCQPFSVAGRRRGADDERNGWPDTIRILREVGPRFALLENVPGLLAHPYFGTVLGDLAAAGFDARWTMLGADNAGAPHQRKRLWILAHAQEPAARAEHEIRERQSDPWSGGSDVASSSQRGSVDSRHRSVNAILPDPTSAGLEGHESAICLRECDRLSPECGRWWGCDPADEDAASESFVGRVADGVAHRVDRLAAIGDGQVPAVVVRAWQELMGDDA